MQMQPTTFADGQLTAVQTGSGPPLLVLHSLLADRSAFDPALPWLAARFRVTLLNLPGFHGSACIAAGLDTYADHLARVFGPGGLGQETIVIGNGFGGTVAVAMALRHGDNSASSCCPTSPPAFRPKDEGIRGDGRQGRTGGYRDRWRPFRPIASSTPLISRPIPRRSNSAATCCSASRRKASSRPAAA